MAIVRTVGDRAAFDRWVASRPLCIQELIAKLPPDRLYRFNRGNGERVLIHSYHEMGDGSCELRVEVLGEYNLIAFERNVFGVRPEHLVECDLPDPDELVGVLYETDEEVDEYIDSMKKRISH